MARVLCVCIVACLCDETECRCRFNSVLIAYSRRRLDRQASAGRDAREAPWEALAVR